MTTSAASKRDQFLAVFPKLVDELIEYMDKEGMPQDAKDWYKKVSEEREIRPEWEVCGGRT
jgi:hypothetical protein